MKILDKLKARNCDPFDNAPITIVCVGDSVTHGCFESWLNQYGKIETVYDPAKSYVRLLQDKLYRLYPTAAVNVINCGIGGDGTAGELARFDRDIARYSPDLVTYCFGLNDCMCQDEEKGYTDYVHRVQELFARTQNLDAECILLTPNMMCTRVDSQILKCSLGDVATAAAQRQNAGVLTRFVNAACEIAREMGIPVADAYGEWLKYAENGVDVTRLLANHINHPIPELHELFVSKLCEVIFSDN